MSGRLLYSAPILPPSLLILFLPSLIIPSIRVCTVQAFLEYWHWTCQATLLALLQVGSISRPAISTLTRFFLSTGGADKNAVVFQKDSEQIVATLKGHTKKVTSVVYHPKEVNLLQRYDVCIILTLSLSLLFVGYCYYCFPGYDCQGLGGGVWYLSTDHQGKIFLRVDVEEVECLCVCFARLTMLQ